MVAMSGPMPPVPADEFVLPLPAAHDESTEPLRRSMDSSHSRTFSAMPSQGGQKSAWKIWRHTVGIVLLLATVIMWTASNFLASVGSHAWFRVAEDTNGSCSRQSSPTTVTLNPTSSLISIRLSSLSYSYLSPQNDCGPVEDLFKELSMGKAVLPNTNLLLRMRTKIS